MDIPHNKWLTLRNTVLSWFFFFFFVKPVWYQEKFLTVNLINNRTKVLGSLSSSILSLFQFPQTPCQVTFSPHPWPLPSLHWCPFKAPHDSQANECSLPLLPFQSCPNVTSILNLNVPNLNQNELSSSSYQLNLVPLLRTKDLRRFCNTLRSQSQKDPHLLNTYCPY